MEIIPHTSVAIWADGTGVRIPPVHKGKNGWVKPIGKQKFGRGPEGQRAAEIWQCNLLRDAFAQRNWEVPVNIDRPAGRRLTPISHPSLVLVWRHPVFGVTRCSVTVAQRYGSTVKLSADLECHPLVANIAKREISHSDSIASIERVLQNIGDTPEQFTLQEASEVLQEIATNPLAFLRKAYPEYMKLLHIDALERTNWTWSYVPREPDFGPEEEVAHYTLNGGDLYLYDRADNIVRENLPLLQRLFEALEHNGIIVEVDKRYRGDGQYTVEGLSIDIPSGGDRLSHNFKINNRGISVMCGYEAEEERYLAHQQRQAMDFYRELANLDPEFTEVEIKLERNQ